MFEELIADLGRNLTEAELPYMIIGGQAVLLYGEPRLTRDIDMTLGVGIESLPRVLEMLGKAGLKPIPENAETFVRETYVLPAKHVESGIRVDIIFSYTPYERQAVKRVNRIRVRDQIVNFASLEDVIIHKVFAGRPRDMEDVRSMILRNPDFDKSYVRQWLKEFGNGFLGSFDQLLREVE
jgi:hypothetical protein